METLKLGYLDDIMTNIHTNWNKLTITQKANLLLKANSLKMLAVIDFSNMSFKEVTSLYEFV